MKWLLVAIIVAATTASDFLQSRELKRSIGDWSSLWRSGWLAVAVACLAVSFFAFLKLLSMEDLSFAAPATAATYVTETVVARAALKERVGGRRWAGALLVAAGVALVARPGT